MPVRYANSVPLDWVVQELVDDFPLQLLWLSLLGLLEVSR